MLLSRLSSCSTVCQAHVPSSPVLKPLPELVRDIKAAVSIPVIASSGAGCVEHFSEVLRVAAPDAVLAAGIFHRREVPISAVKAHLHDTGFTRTKNPVVQA